MTLDPWCQMYISAGLDVNRCSTDVFRLYLDKSYKTNQEHVHSSYHYINDNILKENETIFL